MEGIDWASEGLRQEPLEFEDKFSSTWGGRCREIYHLTSFRKKKVISHDSDIKWKEAWWRWKDVLKAYKVMFQEVLPIPMFTLLKRAAKRSL